MQDTALTLYLGEATSETLTLTNAATGAALDLTGAALTFVVRAPDGATDLLTKALTLDPSPATGRATLALAASDVAALVPGPPYRYKVTDAGQRVLLRGPVFVLPSWR